MEVESRLVFHNYFTTANYNYFQCNNTHAVHTFAVCVIIQKRNFTSACSNTHTLTTLSIVTL